MWKIWEFDAGLYRKRKYFCFVFMEKKSGRVLEEPEDQRRFVLAGITSGFAIVLSCVCLSEGWIANNLVNAFIFVFSVLGIFSFLNQVYLLR